MIEFKNQPVIEDNQRVILPDIDCCAAGSSGASPDKTLRHDEDSGSKSETLWLMVYCSTEPLLITAYAGSDQQEVSVELLSLAYLRSLQKGEKTFGIGKIKMYLAFNQNSLKWSWRNRMFFSYCHQSSETAAELIQLFHIVWNNEKCEISWHKCWLWFCMTLKGIVHPVLSLNMFRIWWQVGKLVYKLM